ncbi:hypothetical protein [Fictibacillus barbaricus]|uniref:Uncharacterized protein n=1 Tax=Fictibacillus barbaricus TaxID=182136 RepID=A0ABS2ZDF5_9BACL|nr:hypothetical protein [Fictibacillus barbaricus]MBN3546202.1 hypothetical protein [Fictibacillus barbaricus]GGB39301.1 hypothetical protein GCM10007199_00500 [Fictibacillus barbaricus]
MRGDQIEKDGFFHIFILNYEVLSHSSDRMITATAKYLKHDEFKMNVPHETMKKEGEKTPSILVSAYPCTFLFTHS